MPVTANTPMYENKRPPRTSLTDAEAARLRSRVPDDPIALPSEQVPCESCGVGVADPSPPPIGECSWCRWRVPVRKDGRVYRHNATDADGVTAQCGGSDLPRGDLPREDPSQGRYGLCTSCTATRERAAQYVNEHPLLARQVGPQQAQMRIEGVLHGLDLLGQTVNVDLGLLLNRMHPVTWDLGYRTADGLSSTRCNPHPWAHVGMTMRANLGKAYADVLRDRIILSKPPVEIACPTIACAMCGIASVKVAAITVQGADLGVVTAKAWQQIDVYPQSLGGPDRPDLIRCHLCQQCDHAVDRARSVGPTAREYAVLAHVERISKDKADTLALRIASEPVYTEMGEVVSLPPVLPGWRVLPTPRVPNAEPWGHLRRLFESL